MNQGSLYQRTHQLNWANQCHVHLPVHIPNSLLRATGNPASPAVHLSRHESSAKLWFMESHHWRNMRSFIIHTVCNFAVLNSNCPTTRKHPCLGCRSWKKGKKSMFTVFSCTFSRSSLQLTNLCLWALVLCWLNILNDSRSPRLSETSPSLPPCSANHLGKRGILLWHKNGVKPRHLSRFDFQA